MNVSRDSVLALQRHFLGALSAPARTWLEPLPSPRLAFAAGALRRTGEACVLDFGTVETPGEERHTLRLFLPGAAHADVRLADFPSWLEVRWVDRTTLELLARHEGENTFHGSLRFLVDGVHVEHLGVQMTTRRVHPAARFDFHGSPVPRPFEFGADGSPYQLSIANDASVPLVVSVADLPAWLTFESDGQCRSGPLPGRFFERTAPFAIRLRPQFLGRHDGSIRIQTNDPRPELRTIDLRLAGCFEPERPFVHAAPPAGIRLRADQTFTAEAKLENWSRSPARTSKKVTPRGLAVSTLPVVPAARGGQPGTAKLPIRIVPSKLEPGTYTLPLTLSIADGEPAEVDVPVHVEIAPAEERGTPRRAALLALLLLSLTLYLVRGLP